MQKLIKGSICCSLLALAACGSNHRPDSPDMLYRSASEPAMLAVPPDVSGLRDRQYIIPRAQGRLSRSAVLPAFDDIVYRRDGQLSWLELNLPVETLWPELVAFVGQRGLEVIENNSLTGLLTTAWMRPTSREPRDGLMQKLIGDKVTIDKSRMERYVIRLERGDDGRSVLLANYQIVHRDEQDSRTVEGDDDKAMSSQLLKDILIWVGVEESRANGVLGETEAAAIRADMQLVSNEQGDYLLLWGDYEPLFEAVANVPGEALWKHEDADVDAGELEIVVDEAVMPRQESEDKPGFWASLLGKGDAQGTALRIRFQMAEAGVYALDIIRDNDQIVSGEIARRLLTQVRDGLLNVRQAG